MHQTALKTATWSPSSGANISKAKQFQFIAHSRSKFGHAAVSNHGFLKCDCGISLSALSVWNVDEVAGPKGPNNKYYDLKSAKSYSAHSWVDVKRGKTFDI